MMIKQTFFRMKHWARGMMMNYMPLMITCKQFEDFMLDYLDGELPDRQRFTFELHIKMCPECRDYIAAYKRTIEVAKRAFKDPNKPVPSAVPDDLVKAILDARTM